MGGEIERRKESCAPRNPLGILGHFVLDEKGRFQMPIYLQTAEGQRILTFSPVTFQLENGAVVVLLVPWDRIGISNHKLRELQPKAHMWDDVTMDEKQKRLLMRQEAREQVQFVHGETVAVEAWRDFFLLYNRKFEAAVAEERQSIGRLSDFLMMTEESGDAPVPPDPAQEKMQHILKIAANIAKETGQRVKVTVEFEK